MAFDKLGHKLITGIANSPQTRWERVRAPVPVPRQAERSASPYRRRITPRYLTNNWGCPPQSAHVSILFAIIMRQKLHLTFNVSLI